MSRITTKVVAAVILAAIFLSIISALYGAPQGIVGIIILLGMIRFIARLRTYAMSDGDFCVSFDFQWRHVCRWYLGLDVWSKNRSVSIRGPPRIKNQRT
jgi:hypothetical protein